MTFRTMAMRSLLAASAVFVVLAPAMAQNKIMNIGPRNIGPGNPGGGRIIIDPYPDDDYDCPRGLTLYRGECVRIIYRDDRDYDDDEVVERWNDEPARSGSRHSEAHYAYCSGRYKSYRPGTNSYTSFSGETRYCNSPYD